MSLRSETGTSLLELVIASGIMVTLGVVTSQIILKQQRQKALFAQQIAVIEARELLLEKIDCAATISDFTTRSGACNGSPMRLVGGGQELIRLDASDGMNSIYKNEMYNVVAKASCRSCADAINNGHGAYPLCRDSAGTGIIYVEFAIKDLAAGAFAKDPLNPNRPQHDFEHPKRNLYPDIPLPCFL